MGSRAQWLAIIAGGVIAGTVDIGAACLIFHADPVTILHAVASGFLGPASFHSGVPSAVLGAVSQIGISIGAAAVYVFAAACFPVLIRRTIGGGLVFGACVYFVMNDIVVPLSNAKPHTHFSWQLFAENMLAMFVFGLLIAFTARYFLAERTYAGA